MDKLYESKKTVENLFKNTKSKNIIINYGVINSNDKLSKEYEDDSQEEDSQEEDSPEEEEEYESQNDLNVDHREQSPEYQPPTSISYKYDGETFVLENERFLQKTFDTVQPEMNYKMSMCIYKCIRNGCTPYLVYLTVYDETTNTLLLPSYQNMQGGGTTEEDVEETENRIMEDFKMQLFFIFPPGVNASLNMEDEEPTEIYKEDLFKGFVLENDTMTMVYDATRVAVELSSDKQYYWATPYEIFVSKKVKHIPIDTTVFHFFDTIHVFNQVPVANKNAFYRLKRLSDNELVKSPYVLFICKQHDSTGGISFWNPFETGKSKFENMEEMSADVVPIVFPRVDHEKIGTFTFFSSLPIQSEKINIARYIVFVDIEGCNPLYIEPDEIDKLDHLYDVEQTHKYSAITFMDGETQIWCIKSPRHFSKMVDIDPFVEEPSQEKPIDDVNKSQEESKEEASKEEESKDEASKEDASTEQAASKEEEPTKK